MYMLQTVMHGECDNYYYSDPNSVFTLTSLSVTMYAAGLSSVCVLSLDPFRLEAATFTLLTP